MEYHDTKSVALKPIKLKNRPRNEVNQNNLNELKKQKNTNEINKENNNKKGLTKYQKRFLVYIHGKYFLFFCFIQRTFN